MRNSRLGRARPAVAAALFALLIPTGAHAAAGQIRTIAGGGVGDGGPALSANLPGPSGIAIDAAGDLFIADRIGNRIREVTPDGAIHTIAGTGATGFFGDGGPAALASLNAPASLALDAAGNIFVADTGNHRVREIRTDGTIVTIAGSGVKGYGGDGGNATSAQLNLPAGVYADATGVYIADTYNNRIRKVTGGIITTAAGNGSAGYYGDGQSATDASFGLPTGVIFDRAGNMFIADQLNHRVRRIDTSNKVSTYAGSVPGGTLAGQRVPLGDGLPAQLARLYFPTSVTLDAAGDLYIADVWDHRVRKVDTSGFMSTVAGTGAPGFAGDGGAATSALLNFPEGVALGPGGDLYFSDTDNHRVRKLSSSTGVIATVAGDGSSAFYGDGGPALGANLYYPSGIASRGDGSVFVADSWNQRVRVIAPDGTITSFAGTGENGFSGDGGPANAATFNYPNDVAMDADGNLYVADTLNNRIRMITPEGGISTVAGTGGSGYNGDDQPATDAWLRQPYGVALDPSGNLFIADTGNNRIREVTSDGMIHTIAGRSGGPGFNGDEIAGTEANLAKPFDVAADNGGNVYVADSGNARVRVVTPDGRIHAYAGDGRAGSFPDGGPAKTAHLSRPYSLLFDTAGAQLYIADAGSEKIYRIDSGGLIRRVAGGGFGFGDGGAAISAGLHGPSGLALAPDGTLLLSDTLAHRVRAISAPF